MSDVLVGSAFATMELRYQQFSDGVSAVEQQIKRLQQLTKTPIVAQAQLAGAGAGSAGLAAPVSRAPSIDADAQAYTRLQRAQAALEAQQARLARTQGDTARAAQLEAQAEQRLTSELQAQTSVTTQSIAIERQLASVQQQAARGAAQAAQQQRAEMDKLRGALTPATQGTSALTGALGGLKSAFGQFGFSVGIAGITQIGISAVQSANSLEKTEATVRALSGSQTRYNQVLTVAQAGQQAYGGSLEENLRGLGTLVNLSNRAGVSLSTLDNISRRLAIVDPVQGIEGANIALKEFLSGDNAEAALSLARRFELPRHALADLAKEGVSAKDRLEGLNRLLNEQGITSEVLAARTRTTAASYDRLTAALSNARDAGGALAAVRFQDAVESGTALLNLLSGNGGIGAAVSGIGRTAGSFDPLLVNLRLARDVADGALTKISQFSGIQLPDISAPARVGLEAYRDLLVQLGLMPAAERAAADSATESADTMENARARERAAINASRDTVEAYRTLQAEAAAASVIAARTQIDIEDRRVQQIGRVQQANADATRDLIANMNSSAQASAVDTAAKDAQQATSALVAAQTRQAADAFLSLNPQIDQSGIVALIAAGKINTQVGQLALLQLQSDQATAALGRLNIAQNIALGAAALVPENRHIGGTGNTVGGVASGIGGGAGTAFARVDAEQRALQDARDNLALARAKTSAERIAIYQQQLARTTDQVERLRIQAQIEGEKRGGVGRVSAAKSTALQLNQVEENSGLQLLKTQRENLERLRDQAEDFEVRRSRAQEDFAEKRRKLLEGGQRKQAELLTRDFEKEQRRAQEDFDRQKRRTLRNNAEGTGDIGARADLRQQQIGDRAALRGVRTTGGVDLGAAAPTLTGAGVTAMQPRVIILRSQIAPTSVQIDGHTIVDITWPEIEQRVDTELANAINGTTTPGSGQTAVAGL